MHKEFITNGNNALTIDLNQWKMSRNLSCKILEETANYFLIENDSGEQVEFLKSLVSSNKMSIAGNLLVLSEAQYLSHFISLRKVQNAKMNIQFEDNKNLIFQHREQILAKGAYYLLRPDFLSSGASHMGSFNYCLGALLDTFHCESPFYFQELAGFKKMYLVKLSGSVLSGVYSATFWSDDKGEFIYLTSDSHGPLPRPLFDTMKSFQGILNGSFIEIDYQDKAIENLLMDINNTELQHVLVNPNKLL